MQHSLKTIVAASVAMLLLPLAEADCNRFDIDPDLPEGYFGMKAPYNDDKVPGGRMQVSKVVHCTEESCAADREPIVLPLESFISYGDTGEYFPAINDALVKLVRNNETADATTLARTNFAPVVYWNYTLPDEDWYFQVGDIAVVYLTPHYRCFVGTMRECDGPEAVLQDQWIEVCGYEWRRGSGPALPADQQQYSGYEWVFPSDWTPEEVANQPPLLWTRSDEFDWSVVGK